MVIVMRMMSYPDGSSTYWTPYTRSGEPDGEALRLIWEMGYTPCTEGTYEPPEPSGWIYRDVIGGIIDDLTAKGHTVIFQKQETA